MDQHTKTHQQEEKRETLYEAAFARYTVCAQCGAKVSSIKGSKAAVCTNCGFRDSCC